MGGCCAKNKKKTHIATFIINGNKLLVQESESRCRPVERNQLRKKQCACYILH